MRFYNLIFAILLNGPAVAFSADIHPSSIAWCAESLDSKESPRELLDQAFKEIFPNLTIYRPGQCYANVIRLFRELRKYEIKLEAKQFRVFYFATPTWVQTLRHGKTFSVAGARTEVLSGGQVVPVEYDFHVILEYQGRVYDLDFTQDPEPVDLPSYLTRFFRPKIGSGQERSFDGLEQVLVYEIPGDWYLSIDPEVAQGELFHQALLSDFSPRSFDEFSKPILAAPNE